MSRPDASLRSRWAAIWPSTAPCFEGYTLDDCGTAPGVTHTPLGMWCSSLLSEIAKNKDP